MSTLVRLWDKDFNLKFTIDKIPSHHIPEQRTLTLPAEHEAAKWLSDGVNEANFFALMTIDDENGRWTAPLDHWKIERVGSCPKCPHCMEMVMRSVWRVLDIPRRSAASASA